MLERWVDLQIERRYGSDTPAAAPEVAASEVSAENLRGAMLRNQRRGQREELALSKQRGEVTVIADAKTRLDRMIGNLLEKLLGLPPCWPAAWKAPRCARSGRRRSRKSLRLSAEELEAICRGVSTAAVVDAVPAPGEDIPSFGGPCR